MLARASVRGNQLPPVALSRASCSLSPSPSRLSVPLSALLDPLSCSPPPLLCPPRGFISRSLRRSTRYASVCVSACAACSASSAPTLSIWQPWQTAVRVLLMPRRRLIVTSSQIPPHQDINYIVIDGFLDPLITPLNISIVEYIVLLT